MRNRVHKERRTLRKSTAMIGEKQTAHVQPADTKQPDRRMVPAATLTSTDNNSPQLASGSTVQQPAGRRRLSAVLHTFGGRFGTAGKRRSPLSSNALSQNDSDQMCLPLELSGFFVVQCERKGQ